MYTASYLHGQLGRVRAPVVFFSTRHSVSTAYMYVYHFVYVSAGIVLLFIVCCCMSLSWVPCACMCLSLFASACILLIMYVTTKTSRRHALFAMARSSC